MTRYPRYGGDEIRCALLLRGRDTSKARRGFDG
jgi:hypothetical protein